MHNPHSTIVAPRRQPPASLAAPPAACLRPPHPLATMPCRWLVTQTTPGSPAAGGQGWCGRRVLHARV